MEARKERSSRHHMKIDLCRDPPEPEGGLLLANPFVCSDISSSQIHSYTPGTPGSGSGTPVLVRSSERSSFKKSRPKSPSLLRFFVRGNSSRKLSSADEEDYGSSGSDHEDPFSPRGGSDKPLPDLIHTNRHTEPSPKSARTESGIEAYMSLPRQHRKHKMHRDSGFSSVGSRGSVSHREEEGMAHRDRNGSQSPEEDYRSRGLEALSILHNQLQILVRSECPEETLGADLQDQVITSLRCQMEDLQESLDCLRQSDHHLRFSLRLAEQRALEADTKLAHTLDRNQRLEQRYMHLAYKYQGLARRHRELEKIQQRQAILSQMGRATHVHAQSHQSGLHRSPHIPQRVQSQREFDREHSANCSPRPSSAQARHGSLSHTETCV